MKSVAVIAVLAVLTAAGSAAAEESDVIFKRTTVWHALTPNDKLSVRVVADPDVEGVACYFTTPELGGVAGTLGVAEEVSDISLNCQQVGPVVFKTKFQQGAEVIRERRSLFFKKMRIVRGCDATRNVLVYMVYSDKLIEGSPKNSTSAVVLRPWADEAAPRCTDWLIP
ncbi:MAG: CreA family protein [Methylobacteriaceae bacterium]|jgi:CreA protein|nr:CreA family protein [Methylobacteriaceae bacterium]